VIVPWRPARIYERGDSIDELRALDLRPGVIDVTAVHRWRRCRWATIAGGGGE